MKDVYISAFGEVVIPEPVKQLALARAIRKHRDSIIEADKYRRALIARWARGTAYFLWKTER